MQNIQKVYHKISLMLDQDIAEIVSENVIFYDAHYVITKFIKK